MAFSRPERLPSQDGAAAAQRPPGYSILDTRWQIPDTGIEDRESKIEIENPVLLRYNCCYQPSSWCLIRREDRGQTTDGAREDSRCSGF